MIRAFLVPLDGEPTVLAHPEWGPLALGEALGKPAGIECRSATWNLMLSGKLLQLIAPLDPALPINPAAAWIGGADCAQLHGPVLTLARSASDFSLLDLSGEDLIVLATRMLIGEAKRALEAS